MCLKTVRNTYKKRKENTKEKKMAERNDPKLNRDKKT